MNLTEAYQEESCGFSNFSCLGASSTVADVLVYMSVTVFVTVTVCGNLLVIISISHFKQLQTPTNVLLLSLAMADFLVGVFVMPLYFIMLIDPQTCFDKLTCTMYNAAGLHLCCVSIYNVGLIAVDRCFAVSKPFHYSRKMTMNLTSKIIIILWLYSLIYNMVFLYFNGNLTDMNADSTCSECIISVSKEWSIIDFIIVFFLPCSTIIIIYLNIFAIVKKQANKIRSVRKCPKRHSSSRASEAKAAKTLGVLVAVFLVCLVPCYVSAFLNLYFSNRSVHFAYSVSVTLIYLNSCINPIIYALFYPWFQKSVKLILTLSICNAESSILNVLERET